MLNTVILWRIPGNRVHQFRKHRGLVSEDWVLGTGYCWVLVLGTESWLLDAACRILHPERLVLCLQS